MDVDEILDEEIGALEDTNLNVADIVDAMEIDILGIDCDELDLNLCAITQVDGGTSYIMEALTGEENQIARHITIPTYRYGCQIKVLHNYLLVIGGFDDKNNDKNWSQVCICMEK